MLSLAEERSLELQAQKRHKRAVWVALILFLIVLMILIAVVFWGGKKTLEEWAREPIDFSPSTAPQYIEEKIAPAPENKDENKSAHIQARGEELYQSDDGTWLNRPLEKSLGGEKNIDMGNIMAVIAQNQYVRDNLGEYAVLLDLLPSQGAPKVSGEKIQNSPEQEDDRFYIGDIYLDKDGVWRNRPSKPSTDNNTLLSSPFSALLPPIINPGQAPTENNPPVRSDMQNMLQNLQSLGISLDGDSRRPEINQNLKQTGDDKQIRIDEYEIFDRSQYDERGNIISSNNN